MKRWSGGGAGEELTCRGGLAAAVPPPAMGALGAAAVELGAVSCSEIFCSWRRVVPENETWARHETRLVSSRRRRVMSRERALTDVVPVHRGRVLEPLQLGGDKHVPLAVAERPLEAPQVDVGAQRPAAARALVGQRGRAACQQLGLRLLAREQATRRLQALRRARDLRARGRHHPSTPSLAWRTRPPETATFSSDLWPASETKRVAPHLVEAPDQQHLAALLPGLGGARQAARRGHERRQELVRAGRKPGPVPSCTRNLPNCPSV